jgi:hydrogenase nickel incorporation protein HypA/HybF
MHELAVCQSMIAQVEELAANRGGGRVVRLNVRIGPLAGVDPELLAHAFPFACAGTVAEGAVLNIDTLPVRVLCSQCGMESDASVNRLVCHACGDFRTRVISGDELLLASFELEPACDTPLME